MRIAFKAIDGRQDTRGQTFDTVIDHLLHLRNRIRIVDVIGQVFFVVAVDDYLVDVIAGGVGIRPGQRQLNGVGHQRYAQLRVAVNARNRGHLPGDH